MPFDVDFHEGWSAISTSCMNCHHWDLHLFPCMHTYPLLCWAMVAISGYPARNFLDKGRKYSLVFVQVKWQSNTIRGSDSNIQQNKLFGCQWLFCYCALHQQRTRFNRNYSSAPMQIVTRDRIATFMKAPHRKLEEQKGQTPGKRQSATCMSEFKPHNSMHTYCTWQELNPPAPPSQACLKLCGANNTIAQRHRPQKTATNPAAAGGIFKALRLIQHAPPSNNACASVAWISGLLSSLQRRE